MKKEKQSSYELKIKALEKILEDLKSSNLKVTEIANKIKTARSLYAECKKELEDAKTEILAFEDTSTSNS